MSSIVRYCQHSGSGKRHSPMDPFDVIGYMIYRCDVLRTSTPRGQAPITWWGKYSSRKDSFNFGTHSNSWSQQFKGEMSSLWSLRGAKGLIDAKTFSLAQVPHHIVSQLCVLDVFHLLRRHIQRHHCVWWKRFVYTKLWRSGKSGWLFIPVTTQNMSERS